MPLDADVGFNHIPTEEREGVDVHRVCGRKEEETKKRYAILHSLVRSSTNSKPIKGNKPELISTEIN
jgi:hypothetical protein